MVRKLSVSLLLAASVAVQAADMPRKAPELALHMADGKDVQLSQFKGKIVALAFISTTCPHCQNYTQTLSAIQKDYAPKGVQILAAAFNDGAQGLLPAFV